MPVTEWRASWSWPRRDSAAGAGSSSSCRPSSRASTMWKLPPGLPRRRYPVPTESRSGSSLELYRSGFFGHARRYQDRAPHPSIVDPDDTVRPPWLPHSSEWLVLTTEVDDGQHGEVAREPEHTDFMIL